MHASKAFPTVSSTAIRVRLKAPGSGLVGLYLADILEGHSFSLSLSPAFDLCPVTLQASCNMATHKSPKCDSSI